MLRCMKWPCWPQIKVCFLLSLFHFRPDLPYFQGAEPPWFAAAMARSLAPMEQNLGNRMTALEGRMTALEGRMAAVEGRLQVVEASIAEIRRLGALVESFFLTSVFSQ